MSKKLIDAVTQVTDSFHRVWVSLQGKKYFGTEDLRVWQRVCHNLCDFQQYLTAYVSPPQVKVILKGGKMPQYKRPGDSGADLYCSEGRFLGSGEVVRIPTGVAFEIPEGFEGQVRPRSGASLHGKVAILGTVDSGYRGEVSVILHNVNDYAITVEEGERVAQIVFVRVAQAHLTQVDTLSDTERGENGFGSSGQF